MAIAAAHTPCRLLAPHRRPAVHRINLDLMTSAPPSIQRQAADFGRAIGMTQ